MLYLQRLLAKQFGSNFQVGPHRTPSYLPCSLHRGRCIAQIRLTTHHLDVTEICKSKWKINFNLLCYLEYTKNYSKISHYVFLIYSNTIFIIYTKQELDCCINIFPIFSKLSQKFCVFVYVYPSIRVRVAYPKGSIDEKFLKYVYYYSSRVLYKLDITIIINILN